MSKKGNVLLIDDEIEIIENLKFLLEGLADNIFLAASGAKGLEIVSQEQIDCIICDLKMPEITGLELLKTLRESGVDKPFIFYSGEFSEESMAQAAKYDVYAFLHKPQFEGIERILTAALAEALDT